MKSVTTEQLIKTLGLEPHPLEGGYFRRTYQADYSTTAFGGKRQTLTSIFYLLTRDSPVGFLHRNRADIVHYFQLGEPVDYLLISPQGQVQKLTMGADILAGQQLQLTVPGGYWKASRLTGGDYSLISEAVTPGFDYADNQLARRSDLQYLSPDAFQGILPWLKACD